MNSTNCVLIGFMGSGKSTIARTLHQASGALALDSDLCIAYNENLSITEIFAQKGESYFRELEMQFCTFVAQNFQHTIIATGGGMPMFCNVKAMGKVFYLHLEFETILQRLSAEEIAQRPLFQDKDSAFKLFNQRLKIYQDSAHHCINANQSVQNITQEILSLL
ncbi:shikimate kinase [Helicobacter sp. MIT 11-5569]|nr:shikimate kinase [Helicobacter sp. MIT 11-5569]